MKRLSRVDLGTPILRTKARRLTINEIKSQKIQKLLKEMFFTLKEVKGVGLAAPQINRGIQLAVINIPPIQRKPHAKIKKRLRYAMINPRIVRSSKKKIAMVEGCISFPDIFGRVWRPSQIDVEYRDQTGELLRRRVSGLESIVWQHEYDHLHGRLWVDGRVDTASFMSRRQYLNQKPNS